MHIKNCSAIVTGAGSGMGQATARFLKDKGARVALLDLDQSAVESAAAEIGALGLVCDVSEAASAEAAMAAAIDANGPPRIGVNCAGIAPAARMVGREGPLELERFAQVINVNLIGTFNLMRLCAAAMQQQDSVEESDERGVIINTASVAAYDGQIGQTAYSASKGGVVAMTLPAARELAKFGIRVVTIAPGLIGTPMLLNMPQEIQDSLASQVPFPSRFGRPEEFARLVGHIISNEMLNGEVIRIDGAIRMQPK